MQLSDQPLKLPIPFGNNAGGSFIRPIPVNSQIGVVDGAASLHDGFVPLNATPIASGGVPPDIKDMNGILFEVSAWSRWQAAGGAAYFDGTFAGLIGGYPKGAVLQSAVTVGVLFVNTTDNNSTNPDAGGAGWTTLMPVPASTAELITGTDTVKYATAAALAGLRASTAQILAGVDTARYMAPAAFYGARALAADITAGTDDHKYLTPFGLAQAFGGGGNSITIGPYTFKWGTYRGHRIGEGGQQVFFPVAFPTACLAVVATEYVNNPNDVDNDMWGKVSSRAADYFWYNYGASSGGNIGDGFDWFAIGN